MRNGQALRRPPVSGRVPSIALSRYADVVYAATCNGGVWRSDDGGTSWRGLMDPRDDNPVTGGHRADSLAVGAVAIHPDHPERVFVGTGEGFGGVDAFFGVGPLVSEDGGVNWTREPDSGGSLSGNGFYAMAVDPTDPERVVAASRAGLYRRELLGGVATWVRRFPDAPAAPATLPALPAGPHRDMSSVVCVRGIFYAARRTGTSAAAQPAQVLRSVNHGETWTVVGTGFPTAAGRITLAVHPEHTGLVYAAVQNGDLWRLSLNAAGNGAWKKIAWTPVPAGIGAYTGTPGFEQGSYDLALVVDPADPLTLYCGGSTVAVDANGRPRANPGANDVYASSIWRLRLRKVGSGYRASPTYIGAGVHADVHTLAFARGLPGQLWVGCDGGVFSSLSAQAAQPVFRSLNSGLATTLVNTLAQHPTEPAILFAPTQDNGGQRSQGDEAWALSTDGDAGYAVVNWANPAQVLMTYTDRTVLRCSDGGRNVASWDYVNVPTVNQDQVQFYAPLAGTPYVPGLPAPQAAQQAARVAFGTRHLWLSDTFGSPNPAPNASNRGDWVSLPSGSAAGPAADRLQSTITAITFAAFGMIYVGTAGGSVFRYTQAVQPGPWVRTRINVLGVATLPSILGGITDIAVDPADPSGNSVYIVRGASADRRHVWHYDNSTWTDRSGPASPAPGGLLNVHSSALVADPANPAHLYLACDVGVWRSADAGTSWAPWGELPEAAVVDLLIHPVSRIIRVATHGRGVFMRRLGAPGAAPPELAAPVQLYLRKHQLDIGLGDAPAAYGQPPALQPGGPVAPGASPDIRCDAPDPAGTYRFDADHRLSLIDFFELSDDDSTQVPTAAQPVSTRVQVLVHQHGPRWSHDVQVTVLLAEGRHGTLPDLPPGWAEQVRAGQPVGLRPDEVADPAAPPAWRTVGRTSVSDLRPGHPQVATVELSSALLPAPGALAGHSDHALLVLVHHADDPLVSTETDAEAVVDGLRQAALRHLGVVAYHPQPAAGPTVGARFLPVGPSPMLNGLAQGGPPVAGRTPGLAVSRHGDIVYAGTANGGVWRSADGGASWRSCMEGFDLDPTALQTDSLACPAVAIHPDVPERVFVGTGEPFGNLDAYFGVGMLVSLDSGRHWLREPAVSGPAPGVGQVLPPADAPVTEQPLLLQAGCYGLVVDPLEPERALAATTAGAFLRESDGVGGWRWRRLWFADTLDGGGAPATASEVAVVTSVACASAGGTTTFVAAQNGGQVFRFSTADASFTAGRPVFMPLAPASWPLLTAPVWLPSQLDINGNPPALPNNLRCSVAMKDDEPGVVYLVRQEGSGFRWSAAVNAWGTITPMPTDPTPAPNTSNWVGGQGWYDLAVSVDPTDVNRIVLGGSTVAAANDVLVVPDANTLGWYSSIWACSVAPGVGNHWALASRYIGARAHADVHRLVFTPGDADELWAGCDGGVFRSRNWKQPPPVLPYFEPRNRGLSTLSGNGVQTHPTEDALWLLSTQDNGTAFASGTPGARMVRQGDGGCSVWHWGDVVNNLAPRVLVSVHDQFIDRMFSGGTVPPAALSHNVNVPTAATGEVVRFYPPMAGSPFDAARSARADRVAFGGQSLWLTDTFGSPSATPAGGDWQSLPSNTAADQLPGGEQIASIVFLTHERIVVGGTAGNVFLYAWRADTGVWVGPQSLAVAGTWPLATAPVVSSLVADPAEPDRAVFVCLGGRAGRRRVWRARMTINAATAALTARTWTLRSGTGNAQLLDVQHNTLAADGSDLYVGADIGIWRSSDAGQHWQPFSEGLPDAPVLDLEVAPHRILRASTHGRGVYERSLPAGPVAQVRLVLRKTVLDRGLRPASYTGRDHTGTLVRAADSPDIRVDAPVAGAYQASPLQGLDHISFAGLADRSATVATHAAGVVNRVYVQVLNSGAEACRHATVHLLLAEAVAGAPPDLPADHAAALRSGLPVQGNGWLTLGVARLGELDAREPRIATFDLHSSLLKPPDELAGHEHWFLLALASHALDPFAATGTAVQALVDANRQAALKAITVNALAGDPPAVQSAPRHLPPALPLAAAVLAQQRLAGLARDSRIRLVSGDHLNDTDRALDALLQAALGPLTDGPQLAGAGSASGLGRYVLLGAAGLDLPDWADYLEARPGWIATALRRGSADEQISAGVADALTVVQRTAGLALATTTDVQQKARIRAFSAGMACAVAAEIMLGPVLRGAAALRGPADPGTDGGAERAIVETWASRLLLGGLPESPALAGAYPDTDDLPPALLPALAQALAEALPADLAERRLDLTPAPASNRPPDADELAEGLALWQGVRTPSHWGMGTWFALLLPAVLAPALGVLLSRLGSHSSRLLALADDSLGPDDPANTSDERSWYQTANFTLACGIPTPLAWSLALWGVVPRRDAEFIQFSVAGGLRTGLAVAGAVTMDAPAGLRWGLVFAPTVATDLYFLTRASIHYAQGRKGSGLLHLIQTLPLMGLGAAWLFSLLIRGSNLRRNEQFWPLWALFTGLLLGGGLLAAWRLSAGGGLIQLLRDRQDAPPLPFDAYAGRSYLDLPAAHAHVWGQHQMWQDGAGVAGERYPAGLRPLMALWHADVGWEIRPQARQVELRQNGGAPVVVTLARADDAAALLAQLQAAVPGLQGRVIAPAGMDLPWPQRLADHGDEQTTWAGHLQMAPTWRAVGRDESHAYMLRQAPRSCHALTLGAPAPGAAAQGSRPLRLMPGRDAPDPLGQDLIGTALAQAGGLAALFQLALAPVLTPGLQAQLAAGSTPLAAGREVLRRWNLDERREAEWRLLVGMDGQTDQAPERLAPGAGLASDGQAVAAVGMLPMLDAWGAALRDDRIDLDAPVSSPSMPLVRPHGEAPRGLRHRELRLALAALLNTP
jgi:hypothetical protein